MRPGRGPYEGRDVERKGRGGAAEGGEEVEGKRGGEGDCGKEITWRGRGRGRKRGGGGGEEYMQRGEGLGLSLGNTATLVLSAEEHHHTLDLGFMVYRLGPKEKRWGVYMHGSKGLGSSIEQTSTSAFSA